MGLSALDWMSDAEAKWRDALQPVNLVIESDFTADEIRTLQSRYGSAADQMRRRGYTYQEVVKKYPALSLMILVGHASLAYDHGAYWESFWSDLGLSRSQDFEQVLRRSVDDLLRKFSLSRPLVVQENPKRKYVMLLALHSAIPVHCLGDLLKLIGEHIAQGRPAKGASVMQWLDEPGKEYRAISLDVPVRNFLMYGAEFAVDILDRIIEVIVETTADPNLLDAGLDSSTTGLPGVIIDELVLQLREMPIQLSRKRATSAPQRGPVITYNVSDDDVVLTLPYPAVGADTPWRVSFDGNVRQVQCVRKWGGTTAATEVRVPGPVREVVVAHQQSGFSGSLGLVAKDDPLITFDRNGKWIPRRDGLKDCVWAVYPQGHSLIDPHTGSTIEKKDDGAPTGWVGWRSAFVELGEVTSIQLQTNGKLVGTERLVRKDARPRFERGEPLVGVQTPDGRAIFASRPWVILPEAPTGTRPRWHVRVRRWGANEWMSAEEWYGEEVEVALDAFDGVEDRQLGLFEIVVAGPLGADARCVVFLAEGLQVDCDTLVRVPHEGGLSECIAEIVAPEGISIDADEILVFEAQEMQRTVTLATADGESSALVVRPPHVQIRSGAVGTAVPWRTTADVRTPVSLADDDFIAVRAPGIDSVSFSYVATNGEVVQINSSPRRRSGDVFEVGTRAFTDSARRFETGRIVATLHAGDGDFEFTALSIRPQQLGTGVALRGRVLEFDGLADLADLAAYVWCVSAPWKPPVVVRLEGSQAILPEDLVNAGRLRCQLFVDDPWILLEPPEHPSDESFTVEQHGWYQSGTRTQRRLSQFLAGEGPLPIDSGATPEAWAAIAACNESGDAENLAQLVKLLADNPRIALEQLGHSTIPMQDKIAMLVRTELVNRPFATTYTLNDLHYDPWFGCMVEIADLPSLYERRNEVRRERAETLGYLGDKGGVLLMELLGSGKSDALHVGCFDQTVFAMRGMSAEQTDAILGAAGLVPGPLLHADTRSAAAYEAFCHRMEWMDFGWSESFAAQTSFVIGPVKRASQSLYAAISERSDRLRGIDVSADPWMLMSLQSLTLAGLARLEAHGKVAGQYLNSGMLVSWTRLAQLCPSMVATDLLIAEALVMNDHRGNLVGEIR